MESLNLVVEDYDLGKNYFDKTYVKEKRNRLSIIQINKKD